MRIKGRVSHVEMRLLFQIIRNRPQFEWGWCCSIYSLLSGVWYIIACSFSFWSFHFLSDLQFLITPFGIFKLFILLSTRRFCGEVEVDFMVIYVVNTVYISN